MHFKFYITEVIVTIKKCNFINNLYACSDVHLFLLIIYAIASVGLREIPARQCTKATDLRAQTSSVIHCIVKMRKEYDVFE